MENVFIHPQLFKKIQMRELTQEEEAEVEIMTLEQSARKLYRQFNLDKKTKEDPDTFGWSYDRCIGYKCTECGKPDLSPAIVGHFDYKVDRIKCYECQYPTKEKFKEMKHIDGLSGEEEFLALKS